MATMDMIKHAGGNPANFLDVGGGASPERVATAFRLVLSDANVKAVLVNIFAGINRCDWVAQGVVDAVRAETIDGVPLVVRLAGTNVEAGRKIIAESGLADHPPTRWPKPPRRPSPPIQRRPNAKRRRTTHEHSDRRNDADPRPGHHRRQGHVSTPRR